MDTEREREKGKGDALRPLIQFTKQENQLGSGPSFTISKPYP